MASDPRGKLCLGSASHERATGWKVCSGEIDTSEARELATDKVPPSKILDGAPRIKMYAPLDADELRLTEHSSVKACQSSHPQHFTVVSTELNPCLWYRGSRASGNSTSLRHEREQTRQTAV